MTTSRDATIQALQRQLGLLIRRTAVPRVHDRITTKAGVDLDRVEAVALSRIVDEGTLGLSELSRSLGVRCSTASRHASHLADRGLCQHSVDRTDARAVVLVATDQGRALVAQLRAAHCEILREPLASWSDRDLDELTVAMTRLVEDLVPLSEPAELVRR